MLFKCLSHFRLGWKLGIPALISPATFLKMTYRNTFISIELQKRYNLRPSAILRLFTKFK